LHRSSREIVDGLRPTAWAIARTPAPVAFRIAISSRSASDRYRPDGAGHEYDDIPPDCRNHLDPTTGATPIRAPAPVWSKPVLTFAQNSRSLAHGCDGAPGDRNGARPVTSLIQSDGLPTATSSIEALLPPVEPSQYTSIRLTDHLALEEILPSIGSVGDAYDNALMESINGLYKAECIRTTVFHEGPYRTIADVEFATAGWVDWYNNRRLRSSRANIPPWNTNKPTTRPSTQSRTPQRSGRKPGALYSHYAHVPSGHHRSAAACTGNTLASQASEPDTRP
jgi:hypothetical protein